MATDISDVRAFAETVAKAQFPNLVLRGSAASRLLIEAFTILAQPLADQIKAIRESQSLATPDLNDASVDALLANIFVTRRPGARATGQVRLFFLSPVSASIPANTLFTSTAGFRFVAVNDQSITQGGMALNQSGDLFFFDVNVVAETEGAESEVAAGEIIEMQQGVLEGVAQVTNPAAMVGGAARETNEEAVDRAKFSITERSLVTNPGIQALLRDEFLDVIDFQTVGFGDPEMLRDRLTGTGLIFGGEAIGDADDLPIGGKVDVYLRTKSRQVRSFKFVANELNVLRGRDEDDVLPIPATRTFVLQGGFVTAVATTPSTTVITDANAAFTPAALVGLTLRVLSGIDRGKTFTVTTNTATTITLPSGVNLRIGNSYVITGELELPIVNISLVEEVDALTEEAVGNVLERDVDFRIISENDGLNFSARSRLILELIGPDKPANLNRTFRVDYETVSSVQTVQDTVDAFDRRVINADLLVKHALPIFLSGDFEFRVGRTVTATAEDFRTVLVEHLEGLAIGEPFEVTDIPVILAQALDLEHGDIFLRGPLEVRLEEHRFDGTIVESVEQDVVTPDRTQSILPGAITFTAI